MLPIPDLLSVGSLIIVGDETQDLGVICELYSQPCELWSWSCVWLHSHTCTGHTGVEDTSQYRGGKTTHSNHWCLPARKFRIQLQREVFNPRLLSLRTSLVGTIVLNAELYEYHSHVSLIQVGEGHV